MRKLIFALAPLPALLAVAPLLAACNTTAGAGWDISNAGQAITNGANNAAQ